MKQNKMIASIIILIDKGSWLKCKDSCCDLTIELLVVNAQSTLIESSMVESWMIQ